MLKISTEKWIACVIKRSGSCFDWNWDNYRTAFRRSYCFGFISLALTVKSKKLNSKITKHEETISIAEAKHLPFGRLFSKAAKDGSISDVEFDLILREIGQYYLLKNQPIKFPHSPILHSVLGQRKHWQKQYVAIGKTDLFYNSMGLCGNFTDQLGRKQLKLTLRL